MAGPTKTVNLAIYFKTLLILTFYCSFFIQLGFSQVAAFKTKDRDMSFAYRPLTNISFNYFFNLVLIVINIMDGI